VLPPQKLRVSQGSLPIGDKVSIKSDSVRAFCAYAAESLFFGYSEHNVEAARQLLTGHQVVVEKKTPSAVMSGRVMAVLDCKDGFVVTSQNYCKIPVLGYALCLLQTIAFCVCLFYSPSSN
jgi:hypothetical protein